MGSKASKLHVHLTAGDKRQREKHGVLECVVVLEGALTRLGKVEQGFVCILHVWNMCESPKNHEIEGSGLRRSVRESEAHPGKAKQCRR